MGGDMTTLMGPGRIRMVPRGWMKRVPLMLTGTMGCPALMAIMNTPFLKGKSSRDMARVPSGKMSQGDAAFDDGRGPVEALDGGAEVVPVHGDGAHAAQGQAQDRDLKERFLGNPEKPARQDRNQGKDVEVGAVIGGKDIGLSGHQVLQALHLDRDVGDLEEVSPPPPTGAVDHGAVPVDIGPENDQHTGVQGEQSQPEIKP